MACAKNCQSGLSQWNCHQSNPLHKFELGVAVANDVTTTTASVRRRFGRGRKTVGVDPWSPGSGLRLYNSAIHYMWHLMLEYILI